MIRKIKVETLSSYLYVGPFDISDANKIITLGFNKQAITFNLNEVLNNKSTLLDKLNVDEIKEICKMSNIKASFYPSGSLSFSKLDSSDDELKSCYVSIVENKYVLVIAFDETQPALYKAQLVGLLEISSEPRS